MYYYQHLRDRLGSTPNTLSDMKITDPVDAEEKYSRVIGIDVIKFHSEYLMIKLWNIDKTLNFLERF